jgi:hypothetical protein
VYGNLQIFVVERIDRCPDSGGQRGTIVERKFADNKSRYLQRRINRLGDGFSANSGEVSYRVADGLVDSGNGTLDVGAAGGKPLAPPRLERLGTGLIQQFGHPVVDKSTAAVSESRFRYRGVAKDSIQ